MHNIYFYVKLIQNARLAIMEDRFDKFKIEFMKSYNSSKEDR